MRSALVVATLVLVACGDSGSGGGGASPTSSNGFGGIGETFCGDEEHTPVLRKPLVYFVLDGSGSMFEVYKGEYRYVHVARGAAEIVEDLQKLLLVGATIFPGPGDNPCAAGEEVYAPQAPDPGDFAESLLNVFGGGTPISATLVKVREQLAGYDDGPVAVVLLTDGGPNCNIGATCGANACTINIEGLCADFSCCSSNCCDGQPLSCLDFADMVTEVGNLKDANVPVYVVGVPGSDVYSTILNAAAVEGGTAQESGDTKYYRVSEFDEIGTAFRTIAASLIECRIGLEQAPEAPEKTNVYFDSEVVVFDAGEGWQWESDAHDAIVFDGDACATLRGGHVSTIRVLSGCPTVVPK